MSQRVPSHRLLPLLAFLCLPLSSTAQVFTVGERTATADLSSSFTPTHVPLPDARLNDRGRRELERMLVAEQGFAHMALPLGAGLTLEANGPLTPGGDRYRHMIFEKGESAAPGDRIMITALQIRNDRILIDLNGGPYEKHRFLSHVQFNNNNVVAPQDKATGARVTLVFPRGLPDISAPEVKALLEPVLDFGVKSSEQAYADTLPTALRQAIAAHEVLVGMNRRMVVAALGQPESKVRERDPQTGTQNEEWIYGHVPQTVQFVRFHGDRVSLLKVAELGKPIQIHDHDELNGYAPVTPVHEIAMGDAQPREEGKQAPAPPTLRQPGEAAPANSGGSGRVQMPTPKPDPTQP